ncbi:fimbrial protein [Enterobacterales bacterium AW_CKDN230030176-1A_HGKHYDSX7]
MKRLACTTMIPAVLALFNSDEAMAICKWMHGTPGELVHNLRLNPMWVPRDAPVGSVIGQANVRYSVPNEAGLILVCNNIQGTEYLTAQVINTQQIVTRPLPPVAGEDLTGRILETGVAGVGVHVRLDSPYTGAGGTPQNYWNASSWHSVPWQGYADHRTGPTGIQMSNLRAFITLIKTGPIAPGPHAFNGVQLFSGSYDTIGSVMRYHLHGTVTAAQCSLKADAVNPDPVALGSHDVKNFTGPGHTTAPVTFEIRLSDCDDNPSGSSARAHVYMQGAQGSTTLDPDLGLFSLSSGSGASGLGIQVLHEDGITPVRLDAEVPVTPLVPGETYLRFQARYYQTAPSVTPGQANGALNFTVTYK